MSHYALHIPTYEAEVRRMSDEELDEALKGTKEVLNRTPKPDHYNEWYVCFGILRTELRRRLAACSLDNLKASL